MRPTPSANARRGRNWYEHQKNIALVSYWVLQMAVIALSAITPVLILVDDIPKAVQALPPALAAIAAGALGMFQMRETAGAFEVTATRLKNELFLFENRSGVYEGADPARRFVETIVEIESETTAEWRDRLVTSAPQTDRAE